MTQTALFPLHTVLFPGGRLPLQIFEARYLDMVSQCLKDNSRFVIVLIRDGDEVVRDRDVAPPRIFEIGTLARIADWDAPESGKLLITAEGERKARITGLTRGPNHLLFGEVEILGDENTEFDENHPELHELLGTLMLHPMIQHLGVDVGNINNTRLSYLLAQYLPVDERRKQTLLALDDTETRLQEITRLLNELNS